MKVKTSKSRTVRSEIPQTVKVPKNYPWVLLLALTKELGQYLTEAEKCQIETILRNRDVSSLLQLSKEWGLQSVPPSTGDFAFSNFKAKYQLAALLKKFQFPANRKMCEDRALQKFMDAEAACSFFNREGWKKLATETVEWKLVALSKAKGFLQKLLGFVLPEHEELTEWSRHGPGASFDTEPGKVSSYFKYENWPYQCTAAAYRYAKDAIRNDARWLGALEDDYRTTFGIKKWELLDRRAFWRNVLKIVPGARIAFVPKNAEIFRTITIEPTMNVFLQLGVDGFIKRRLIRWGVDLRSQEKNQRLARIGSRGGEDPFVTIDLASASDTVSLKICEILLPDEWYTYLLDLRSPSCELGAERIYFNKISAMGNGFTFVLESAIFTSIIYGVMMATNGTFTRDDFAVYGDDLVVRKSIANRVIEMLTDCGFAINTDKSFFDGPVRESCGCDWFEGKPVRPVFLENTPTDVKELFSARNRLKRCLSLRWGIEESEVVRLMDKWIPEYFRDHIGPLSDTDFDSHIHMEVPKSPRGVGRNRDVWECKRAVYRSLKHRACFPEFRKLMHDLRPIQSFDQPYGRLKKKIAGSGSRFTVHIRNGETVGTQFSAAWKWQAEYADILPVS